MVSLQANSIVQAWAAGAKHLNNQQSWTDFNLVLGIKEPMKFLEGDKGIFENLDALLKKYHRSIHTVAETIFPGSLYKDQGAKAVYQTYPEEVYPKIKSKNPWGTYAHRLVRHTKKGKTINPLEIVVSRMARQLANKGNKRACYEISLTDAQTDIPIFDNEIDIRRSMGGPCLSHVSFKLDPETKKVHLTALYRSHYYIERALGNLLGLARLQDFVAREVGATPGELVCISTYAKIDQGGEESPWSKAEVQTLLSSL